MDHRSAGRIVGMGRRAVVGAVLLALAMGSRAGFGSPEKGDMAERRAAYIQWVYDHFSAMEPEMAPTDGRRWALNHARLVLNRDVEKASSYMQSAALTNDSDIYFIRFLKTLLDFQDSPRLSAKAKAHLVGILTAWPRTAKSTVAKWPPVHTENHDLMNLTIWLFAEKYRGHDVTDHMRQIHQALAWRFERGFVEWNSACYQYHYSNPLIILAEHAPSEELRREATDTLNVLLAERALLSVNGYLGGPSFRCRTADAHNSPTDRKVAYLMDGRYDGFLPTVWLAFGLGEPRFDFEHARVPGLEPATTQYASGNEPRLKQDEGVFFACSTLEPHPLVVALAEEAASRDALVYRGQRFLGWPAEKTWETQRWLPGDVCYYNTPYVSMGSVHSSGWICQSRYDQVLFGADPSQGLRVEIVLPDVPPSKRRYEARGRVVQHKNWLLGQGTLFEDGGVKARRVGDWNVYQVGKGLCAHLALPDAYHVLQVSDLDRYADEEAFVKALPMPKMEKPWVRTKTVDGDEIAVDTRDMSIAINGTPRVHPPKMLHDSEAMQSEYGSGRITINTKKGSVTFACNAVKTK